MRFLCAVVLLLSGQVVAATITIEANLANPVVTNPVDFTVIVDPQGLTDWGSTVEVLGPTSSLQPMLRTPSQAGSTRVDYSVNFTGAAAALALKVTALRISEAAARTANLFRKCGQGFIFFPPVLHDAIN